jgi:hypothetical protein
LFIAARHTGFHEQSKPAEKKLDRNYNRCRVRDVNPPFGGISAHPNGARQLLSVKSILGAAFAMCHGSKKTSTAYRGNQSWRPFI